MDQVDRIAYDNGGSLGGGGGVSVLEAEVRAVTVWRFRGGDHTTPRARACVHRAQVLQLRRELAAAKVKMAETAMEREELDHVARKLNKQLADLAATQH